MDTLAPQRGDTHTQRTRFQGRSVESSLADVRAAGVANGLAPYNVKSLSRRNFFNFILFMGVRDSKCEKDQILINEHLSMA